MSQLSDKIRFATLDEQDAYFRTVVAPDCSTCGATPCYFICPNSPCYYSDEQERTDDVANDALSYDEWFRLAVQQFECVHGMAYVS